MQKHPQKNFMQIAIDEAKKSALLNQYAIGAVVVDSNGEIVSIAHTNIQKTKDPTSHAETNAIREACKKLDNQYLEGCWLYSTLEPCPMCTATAIWAKMSGIVYGATKEDGQKNSWRQIDISSKEIAEKGKPKLEIIENFMRGECCELFN